MKAIPARAQWLLDRFGISQKNEALMGDLVEEYGSGRSSLWVWRQTLVAVAEAASRGPSDRKTAMLRAAGLVVVLSFAFTMVEIHVIYRIAGHPDPGNAVWYVYGVLMSFVWPAMVGWVVASTHRVQRVAAVVTYLVLVAAFLALRVYVGHETLIRSHQMALFIGWSCLTWVCALAGSLLARPRPCMRQAGI